MKADRDLEAVQVLLDGMPVGKRERVLALYRDRTVTPAVTSDGLSLIVSPKRTGEVLGGKSLRTVHTLAQAGHLKRVFLPGRKRAAGFTRASVLALVGIGP